MCLWGQFSNFRSACTAICVPSNLVAIPNVHIWIRVWVGKGRLVITELSNISDRCFNLRYFIAGDVPPLLPSILNNAEMAQYRQSGSDRYALRGHDLHNGNGASDHVSIGIRAQHKQSRARRSSKGSRISVGAVVLILSLVLTVTVFAYNYISGDSGIGSACGDSRYWERDDRRRDEDYNEEALEHSTMSTRDGSIDKSRVVVKGKNDNEKIFFDNSIKGSGGRGSGLYNEAGRDELKIYEAEYEASLKNVGQSINEHGDRNKLFDDAGFGMHNEEMDADDEYDDGIDSHDARMVEDDDNGHENGDISNVAKSHDSSDSISAGTKDGNIVEEVDESSSVSSSLNSQNSRHVSVVDGRSTRKFSSEKRPESKEKDGTNFLVLREEPQLDECRKSSVKTKAAIRCQVVNGL
ncbi:hypothetical protein CK203_091245 [Vitis vinifera]|uniref:Uncharacterized protein n=1 Tax=Vitis vinifera TaxID=29760 RepID=A0A438EMM2_VITVI|nr:hypothetical protein CK203_091245 [Vitis vinifera]